MYNVNVQRAVTLPLGRVMLSVNKGPHRNFSRPSFDIEHAPQYGDDQVLKLKRIEELLVSVGVCSFAEIIRLVNNNPMS